MGGGGGEGGGASVPKLAGFRVLETHLWQCLVAGGVHLEFHQGDLRSGGTASRALPSLTCGLSCLGVYEIRTSTLALGTFPGHFPELYDDCLFIRALKGTQITRDGDIQRPHSSWRRPISMLPGKLLRG